jgi:hypothetical protein
MSSPVFRFLAIVMATASLVTVSILGGQAPSASAETANVVATCATLTVKPNGFAAKGEVRVIIDGDIQTEGTSDGWRSFSGSYSGIFAFDPQLAHDYTVEINSFGSDSAGRTFTPGVGFDSKFEGPTTPCGPVGIQAAASNCVSSTAQAKQSVDLTLSSLRTSTTYLVNVLDDSNTVVKHFQFRTAPTVRKTFTGLQAGAAYRVVVEDQSDATLSSHADVTIPGCAQRISADLSTRCDSGSRVDVALSDLVPGRAYTARLTGAASQATSFVADDSAKSVRFGGIHASGDVRVEVSDDAAPRQTTVGPIELDACSTGSSTDTPTSSGSGSTTGSTSSTSGGFISQLQTFVTSIVSPWAAHAASNGQSSSGQSSSAQSNAGQPGSQLQTLAEGDSGPGQVTSASQASWALPATLTALALIALVFLYVVWRRRRESHFAD